LARKLPVIVDFIEPRDSERHFALIIALDGEHIVLNDPENGEKFSITVEEFDQRWADARNRYVRWMMVVSKEPFGLGQQFDPRGKKSFANAAFSKITKRFSRKDSLT
jgi:predicted double-glycine peptidase